LVSFKPQAAANIIEVEVHILLLSLLASLVAAQLELEHVEQEMSITEEGY